MIPLADGDGNEILELKQLIKNINITSMPPTNGSNVTVVQNKYDLIFKDILISSDKRDSIKYPNPNKYSMIIKNAI